MDRRALLRSLLALPLLSCANGGSGPGFQVGEGSTLDWPEAEAQFEVQAIEDLARSVEDLGGGELLAWIQSADLELRRIAARDPELGALLGAGFASVVGGGLEILASLAVDPAESSEALAERFNQVLGREDADLKLAVQAFQGRFDGNEPDLVGVSRRWHLCMDAMRASLRPSGAGENLLALQALARHQQDALALRETPGSELVDQLAKALERLPEGPPPPSDNCGETQTFLENWQRHREKVLGIMAASAEATLEAADQADIPLGSVLGVPVPSVGTTILLVGFFAQFLLLPFLLYVPDYPAVATGLPVDFCACGAF